MTKNELYDIYKMLKVWCESRNIDYQGQKVCLASNLLEEVKEFVDAKNKHEQIDALCDILVFCFNSLYMKENIFHDTDGICEANFNIQQIMNTLTTIIFNKKATQWNILNMIDNATLAIRSIGYRPYPCMLETIKEISSREQDADQKVKWALLQERGEPIVDKWQKNKTQDPATLYKANYFIWTI